MHSKGLSLLARSLIQITQQSPATKTKIIKTTYIVVVDCGLNFRAVSKFVNNLRCSIIVQNQTLDLLVTSPAF